MSFMTNKFRGKYRLKTEYDQFTNQFPRDLNDNYSDHDIYISCANEMRISYYGKGVLQAYIPSLGRGRNIVKAIYSDFISDVNSSIYASKTFIIDNEAIKIDYDGLYNDKELNKIIFDIEETDSEVLCKFKWTYMEEFEKYFKPKISAADRSPFSSRNLPKGTYIIPDEDIKMYKQIVDKVPKEHLLKLGFITRDYVKSLSKSKKKQEEMKAEMKQKLLKNKEYIHYIGNWNDYITYLEKEVSALC